MRNSTDWKTIARAATEQARRASKLDAEKAEKSPQAVPPPSISRKESRGLVSMLKRKTSKDGVVLRKKTSQSHIRMQRDNANLGWIPDSQIVGEGKTPSPKGKRRRHHRSSVGDSAFKPNETIGSFFERMFGIMSENGVFETSERYFGLLMIHPHSRFAEFWRAIIDLCIGFMILCVPFKEAFVNEEFTIDGFHLSAIITVLIWAVDVLFTMDLFVQFTLSMPSKHVSDDSTWRSASLREVWGNYVIHRGTFIFDLSSTVGAVVIMISSELSLSPFLVSIFSWMRLARGYRLLQMLGDATGADSLRSDSIVEKYFPGLFGNRICKLLFSLVNRVFITLFLAHISSCLLMFIGDGWLQDYISSRDLHVNAPPTAWEKWTYAMYWSIVSITTVGYGEITPSGLGEQLWAMAMGIVGSFLFGYFVGELTQVITESKYSENEFKHKLSNLEKFLGFYEFDAEDKLKIIDQYHSMYEVGAFFNRTEIIRGLPQDMQQLVLFHMRKRAIAQVPIFHKADSEALEELTTRLKPKKYEPEAMVIQAGDVGRTMYFVESGEVKVVIPSGDGQPNRVFTHGPNRFFGQIAILKDELRAYSVFTTRPTILLELSKIDFEIVVQKFPQLLQRVAREAEMREASLKRAESRRESAERQATDLKAQKMADLVSNMMGGEGGKTTSRRSMRASFLRPSSVDSKRAMPSARSFSMIMHNRQPSSASVNTIAVVRDSRQKASSVDSAAVDALKRHGSYQTMSPREKRNSKPTITPPRSSFAEPRISVDSTGSENNESGEPSPQKSPLLRSPSFKHRQSRNKVSVMPTTEEAPSPTPVQINRKLQRQTSKGRLKREKSVSAFDKAAALRRSSFDDDIGGGQKGDALYMPPVELGASAQKSIDSRRESTELNDLVRGHVVEQMKSMENRIMTTMAQLMQKVDELQRSTSISETIRPPGPGVPVTAFVE